MKHSILRLRTIVILLLACPYPMTGNDAVNQEITLPAHPRILLLQGEEEGIRQTIASDEIWEKLHLFIIGECEEMIGMPAVERVLTGRRLLAKSREALRRIFYLSYAYRMTYETKYLERAEKELIAISNFTDWNPSHFLDVAEMTMAASIGYDWLYGSLPEETIKMISDAIIEKGLKPSLLSNNNSWVNSPHNWNQVCNAGMVYGALAIYENDQELAEKMIDRAKGSIILPMEDYMPDGAYPEGYGYWGYGTSFNIMFLSAMEKISGINSVPVVNEGFLKTAGYLENMTGPTGKCFNYSDAGQGGGLQPAMFWFANRLNDPSLLWSEKYHILNNNLPGDRLLPAIMIWGSGITLDKIKPPSGTLWAGQGKNPVALFRSSWNDSDAVYVGLKGGSPSVNHGHMDAGSFIMEALGERWAMDFGVQDYNSLETAGVYLWGLAQNSQRWEVYRYNNFVHNTLTVNDSLQNVGGYSPITAYSESPLLKCAITDITSLYKHQLKKSERGVAIVDGKYFMVRDEIETLNTKATIRWNMLTSANVAIIGNDVAELTKNGKRVILKVKSPAGIILKTVATIPPNSYDAPNPGTTMIRFETEVPANSATVLTVIIHPEGVAEDTGVTGRALSEWIHKIE